MTDLTGLTWQELVAELDRVKAEITRRHTIEHGEREAENANRRFLAAAGIEPCQPWRQPTHALDAYPRGWTVDHNDQCWISTTPANMFEPGPDSECWEPHDTDNTDTSHAEDY